MPSLVDSLSSLADRSESITHLSHANYRPTGPFTHAILDTPSVLQLIRDAEPAEARLFKFIGEEHGGNKKVEKRDGVVTPLKEMKGGGLRGEQAPSGRNGDQVGVMLKTALRLVDDYRPMPRARAHIQALLDSHQAQLERVAELEQLINDATSGTTTKTNAGQVPASPTRSIARQRTIDESIRAEEASLKRLEAYLAQHRKAASSSDDVSDSTAIPPQGTSFPASSTTMATPARPQARSRADSASASRSRSPSPQRRTAQTPAKTPNSIHIANSLVNGMTPRRTVVAQQTLNRFSPLKLLGTPRAPVGNSGLRDESEGPRPIFSRASILKSSTNSGMGRGTMTPASRSVFGAGSPATVRRGAQEADEPQLPQGSEAAGDTDETVRFGGLPPVATDAADVTAVYQRNSPEKPTQVDGTQGTPETGGDAVAPTDESPSQPTTSVEPEPVVETGPRKVEGVEVDSEQVKQSTDKVWATMPDVMRQGLKDGTELEQGVESTVKHLQMLARSDPPAPPSPSSASSLSSLSSTAPPKAPPITQQTILLAHLLLLLLRSPDGTVSVQAIKETLGSTARARGWEGGQDIATKIIYMAVGKRVVKIDRRGGSGGKVAFNL